LSFLKAVDFEPAATHGNTNRLVQLLASLIASNRLLDARLITSLNRLL